MRLFSPVASLAVVAWAAPERVKLDSLPGWDGELLSNVYAGHVNAGKDGKYEMFEHYMFFESEGDPKTDPLIMWTNGGPGAPSYFGVFTELGPYYLSSASLDTESYKSTGVPSLLRNVQSWTKHANIFIRNAPPPVGYSYCLPAGPGGDGYSCGDWDDARYARHSFNFLNNWFRVFPEYAAHDFFLIGESYAGIYVPITAREILKHPDSIPAKQLRGIAVGDGCVGGPPDGCTSGPINNVKFWYGHGQVSTNTFNEIHATCSRDELYLVGNVSKTCRAALDKMDVEKGYSFEYGLYDECYDFDLGASAWDAPHRLRTLRTQHHSMDGAPCGGSGALAVWAKNGNVKEALSVPKDAAYFSGDNGVGFNYKSDEPNLAPVYKRFALETNLRVLLYNGDADPSLNSFAGEEFTKSVGLKEKEGWRPWTEDGKIRMGGYVTRYEGNFDYLTIRGAGHMVPEYKPLAATAFLKAWLANEDYPRLNVPSAKSIVV